MLLDIQNCLQGHPWGEQIHWFDEIDSTNTKAKEMALSGAPHGTVLIADHQTGGRGRLGRSFQSPCEMGVYLSVLLRPQCSVSELMHLTCATAVAACNAVERVTDLRPGIKWTNDLVCGKRKMAGILTELVTIGDQVCAVVGIGINCCQSLEDFSEELCGFAGSLRMATGKTVDRAKIAAALIEAVYCMDLSLISGKTVLMDQYRRDCITIGQDVSLLCADQIRHGHALSVNDDGALVVRFEDNSVENVFSGEISVRGMYGYV